jgi:hypothetical protein
LKFLDLLVNMLKLGIAVRMRAPLKRLSVGLQAIAHLLEQCCDHAVAGLMSHPFQLVGQLAHAFGSPAQWRLRIASGHRLDETFQVRAKGLISVDGALTSSTGLASSARAIRRGLDLPRGQELLAPTRNGGPRNPGGLRNQSGASVSKRKSLCANIEPQAPLVQQWSKQLVAFFDRLSLHANSITRPSRM